MILKNQNGSAIGMAVITLGAALAVSMYVLRVSTTAQLSSADIIKVQHLVPYKEKISRIGGFLIASNLIICKSDSWSNGAAKETCAWSGQNVAGGNTYKASDLGLLNEQMDGDNYLKYDLDLQYMFGQQSFMTGKNSSIRFKLLPTSEIKTSLGQQSSQQQTMDQDKFLIQMIISLEYINSKGKAQLSEFKSIFKRPIAIPKIKLTSSSCVSKCDVSISENPNPSCRSPQYNDPQTMTVVNGYIKNLGPGSLYKLGYERTMNYGPGSGPQGQSAQTTPEEMVVNLGDYLVANNTKTWADSFPCGYSAVSKSNTVNTTKTVMNNVKYFNDVLSNQVSNLLDVLFIPTSNAAWRTVNAGKSASTVTTTAQHAFQAGSVNYKMNSTSTKATIEPYKLLNDNNALVSGFDGIQDVTTTTTTYTQLYRRVWVQPSH